MSVTLQFNTTVLPGHRIQIESPDLPEGLVAFVTVKLESAPLEKRPLSEILAGYQGKKLFKTAEEVDAYMREERDSWDK
jgi:hypothetical protein